MSRDVRNQDDPQLVSTRLADSPSVDAFSRLRTSEPFGIFDNKNTITNNRNQWEEIIKGAIIVYNTLAGGPFTAGEEIRGTLPAGIIAIADIVSDNGATSMVIDVDHNDFVVGDTITGQTSGATAVAVSTGTGSNIQHDYDTACMVLTAGTGSTDRAIRQSHRYTSYVPGKSQLVIQTFVFGSAVENVGRCAGYFDDNDGLFFAQDGTDGLAFVRRTSTSGSPVDNFTYQTDWNLDTFDGKGPSQIELDMTKAQILIIDFQWLGVGRVRFGFDIDGCIVYAHEILNANNLDGVFMRTPTLPVRYEVTNKAATGSQTTMNEICSSVNSEGGYIPPGLEFSQSMGITDRTVAAASLDVPVFAIRLKDEFPAGRPNRRTARFLNIGATTSTNDAHFYVRHIHEAFDVTATWSDVAGGSAVEYSTDISAITGRPSHTIENLDLPTGAANKAQSSDVSGEFINLHGFISQNFDSTESQMFVVFAQAKTGNADVRCHITWIEFD